MITFALRLVYNIKQGSKNCIYGPIVHNASSFPFKSLSHYSLDQISRSPSISMNRGEPGSVFFVFSGLTSIFQNFRFIKIVWGDSVSSLHVNKERQVYQHYQEQSCNYLYWSMVLVYSGATLLVAPQKNRSSFSLYLKM